MPPNAKHRKVAEMQHPQRTFPGRPAARPTTEDPKDGQIKQLKAQVFSLESHLSEERLVNEKMRGFFPEEQAQSVETLRERVKDIEIRNRRLNEVVHMQRQRLQQHQTRNEVTFDVMRRRITRLEKLVDLQRKRLAQRRAQPRPAASQPAQSAAALRRQEHDDLWTQLQKERKANQDTMPREKAQALIEAAENERSQYYEARIAELERQIRSLKRRLELRKGAS